DGVFRGPVTARAALQASLNLPVVALTEALGPARLLAALRRAGVTAVVPGDAPGLAVALGGVGVSLEGLVQLYAAIARGGEARALTVRAGEGPERAGEVPVRADAPALQAPAGATAVDATDLAPTVAAAAGPRPNLMTPE